MIVFLTTKNDPILADFVEVFKSFDIGIDSIIYDGYIKNDRKNRYLERAGKYYEYHTYQGSDIDEYMVENHNSYKCESILKRLQPDIIVNAGTPRILKKNILNIPKLGVLNSHPAKLPQYQGCTTVEWTIYNGDNLGATCHYMSEDIDAGPIIYYEEMDTSECECYEHIRANMIYHLIDVMAKGCKLAMNLNKNWKKLDIDLSDSKYYNVIDEDKMNTIKKMCLKDV
jgi:folate-dependent phosphoribosylglycinamide formyltransferase PurN